MTVKRGRDYEEGERGIEALAMANCLMLLSKGVSEGRVFTCKTCHRQFSTFQALGGHRASHGKPKLESTSSEDVNVMNKKMHGCSICGKTFLTGQSLGGHMRRHRGVTSLTTGRSKELTAEAKSIGNRSSTVLEDDEKRRKIRVAVDLNLTPLQNYLRHGNASFNTCGAQIARCSDFDYRLSVKGIVTGAVFQTLNGFHEKSGMHQRIVGTDTIISDVYCNNCKNLLGWKYIKVSTSEGGPSEGDFLIPWRNVVMWDGCHFLNPKTEELLV